MKNKFKDLISNDLIYRLLLVSKIITKDTSKEDATNLFNKLDEKYRLYRAFSELYRESQEKYGLAIKYLEKSIKEAENTPNTFYHIGLVKTTIRSYLAENIKEKKESKFKKELQVEKEPILKPLNFSDFMSLVDNKEYYVENMFAKGTINMIFSPPASMKSFISYYLGLCICKGQDFFCQKTKKVNVGYFDWENPLSDIQNRVKGICKGLNYDLSDIDNFYFFIKQPTLLTNTNYDSYVSVEMQNELIEFVKDNQIKVLFFDTLRRLGNFDENDSRAINTIKSELFDPLIKETGVCIIFLHHTSKEGKKYRGSVDIEGILDTSFSINKKINDNSTKIIIKNCKRRNNEIEILNALVEIENESILTDDGQMMEVIHEVKFYRADDEQPKEDLDYSLIRRFFMNNLDSNIQYKNKDLANIIKKEFGKSSSRTISKILNWLVSVNVLSSYGSYKKKYYTLNMINVEFSTNIEEKIENHFNLLFKEIDIINLQNLKDKFKEEHYSIVINRWNEKGWLNLSKKNHIAITNLYREENK